MAQAHLGAGAGTPEAHGCLGEGRTPAGKGGSVREEEGENGCWGGSWGYPSTAPSVLPLQPCSSRCPKWLLTEGLT